MWRRGWRREKRCLCTDDFGGVVDTEPTWDVLASCESGAAFDGKGLSAEEELIVLGLVLPQNHYRG